MHATFMHSTSTSVVIFFPWIWWIQLKQQTHFLILVGCFFAWVWMKWIECFFGLFVFEKNCLDLIFERHYVHFKIHNNRLTRYVYWNLHKVYTYSQSETDILRRFFSYVWLHVLCLKNRGIFILLVVSLVVVRRYKHFSNVIPCVINVTLRLRTLNVFISLHIQLIVDYS